MADLPAYEDTQSYLPTYDETIPQGIPGTANQGSFEETIRQLLPNAPKSVTNSLIGLAQGLRELGHGVGERVIQGANAIEGAPQANMAPNPDIQNMQAQEQQFNQLHPNSVMTPEPGLNLGREAGHIAPYFAGGPLEGALAGGLSQPERPGENPLTSPATSLVATGALALPIGILNKAIVKGYNSGALRDTIDSIGIPKVDLNKQGAYQAIKDFASNPANAESKQFGKASNFVNTIEDKASNPTFALALRSDVGGKYLQNSVKANELYATRDALGDKLGPIDASPLLDKIQGILEQPQNIINLGGRTSIANRGVRVLQQSGVPSSIQSDISGWGPDATSQVLSTLDRKNLSYSDLSSLRSAFQGAASKMQGNPASTVYSQLGKAIEDYQSEIASKGPKELASADSFAKTYYKNNVVPYEERGIAKSLGDKTVNSEDIYKIFANYTQDNPEQITRMMRLTSPDGQQAIRSGFLGDAISASTNRNGYIDPVMLRNFTDSSPNLVKAYLEPKDQAFLKGIQNLVSTDAKSFGDSAIYYQRYMQLSGAENVAMGEFSKGSHQIVMPVVYNQLMKFIYRNQKLRDFMVASSKLNPSSPEAANAMVKFNRLLRQATIGTLSTSDMINQATNQLMPGDNNGLER